MNKAQKVNRSKNNKEFRLALAITLDQIAKNDENYKVRNPLVLQALVLAQQVGYEVGFRFDPSEPEWPVAFIELPTGQISWHLPQHIRAWDTHTVEQKFVRIDAFSELVRREFERDPKIFTPNNRTGVPK